MNVPDFGLTIGEGRMNVSEPMSLPPSKATKVHVDTRHCRKQFVRLEDSSKHQTWYTQGILHYHVHRPGIVPRGGIVLLQGGIVPHTGPCSAAAAFGICYHVLGVGRRPYLGVQYSLRGAPFEN